MESTSTPCRRRTLDKTITASPAEQSIAHFVARHPTAEVQRLQNGFSVRVPDASVDASAWSKPLCAVAFVIPGGFPALRPDCFWTDGDLRLRNGQMPANSGFGTQHPLYTGMLWFSYHPKVWDVRDTVETYWHLIQGRLLEPR
jgi:hypothetical protein